MHVLNRLVRVAIILPYRIKIMSLPTHCRDCDRKFGSWFGMVARIKDSIHVCGKCFENPFIMTDTITHCRMCQTRFGPGRWDAKRSSVYSHVCTSCFHDLPGEPPMSPQPSPAPSIHGVKPGAGEASISRPAENQTVSPSYSGPVSPAPGGNQIT